METDDPLEKDTTLEISKMSKEEIRSKEISHLKDIIKSLREQRDTLEKFEKVQREYYLSLLESEENEKQNESKDVEKMLHEVHTDILEFYVQHMQSASTLLRRKNCHNKEQDDLVESIVELKKTNKELEKRNKMELFLLEKKYKEENVRLKDETTRLQNQFSQLQKKYDEIREQNKQRFQEHVSPAASSSHVFSVVSTPFSGSEPDIFFESEKQNPNFLPPYPPSTLYNSTKRRKKEKQQYESPEQQQHSASFASSSSSDSSASTSLSWLNDSNYEQQSTLSTKQHKFDHHHHHHGSNNYNRINRKRKRKEEESEEEEKSIDVSLNRRKKKRKLNRQSITEVSPYGGTDSLSSITGLFKWKQIKKNEKE